MTLYQPNIPRARRASTPVASWDPLLGQRNLIPPRRRSDDKMALIEREHGEILWGGYIDTKNVDYYDDEYYHYYHDILSWWLWRWHVMAFRNIIPTKFLPTPPTIAIISKLGISSFPIYRSQVRWLETTILTLPPRIIVQWKVGVSPIGSLHFEYPSIFHWSMILPSQILLPTSPPRNHRIRPYDQGLSTIGFLNVLWCLFSSCPSTKNLNSWRSTPIATNAKCRNVEPPWSNMFLRLVLCVVWRL